MFHSPFFFRVCVAIVVFLSFSYGSQAQVGINTTDPKAALDVAGTDGGLLIPRVALTATNVAAPIVDPQISELIYNTATDGLGSHAVRPGFYYWDGSLWVQLNTGENAGSGDSWQVSGNAGTTPGTDFVGTTDAKALQFKTDGNIRLTIPVGNQIHANARGTAEAPFYSFADNPTTGVFSPSPNVNFVSIATDGEEQFRVGNANSNQDYISSYLNHRFANGTATYPSISFETSRTTGLFRPQQHTLGVATGGEERMRISKMGTDINGAISLREGPAFDLQNGLNTLDFAAADPRFSQYRITGPTAAFSVQAITPITDADGQLITLINTTAYPLTLIHNQASVPANARVFCPTESNFVLNGRYATVTLQYNKTLGKWVVTDFADGGSASPSNSITSVKGTTDTYMNSSNFTDMQGMSITFTPQNPVVHVSFSASGHMDVDHPMPSNAGASFRLVNVTAGNRVEAGISALATDYDGVIDSNGYYHEWVISAWNASLNTFPVSVTPGVPTTLKIQWARDAATNPKNLHCNVVSDPNGAHRSLTIFN